MEIWKDIPEYKGYYQASSLGRIKSLDRKVKHPRNPNMELPRRGHILKYELDKCGHPVVTLSLNAKTKTYKVHRLVASAFIPNPDNLPQIDHINNRKYDNRPENLRWCTTQENTKWRDENNPRRTVRRVLCKDNGKVFDNSYHAAFWLISKGKTISTNYKTVSNAIRYACVDGKKRAYRFHWAYLEGSEAISKESREKSRNGGPRDRRVKI